MYTAEEVIKHTIKRAPDITNLYAILNNQAPKRPTLFEFYTNNRVETAICNAAGVTSTDPLERKILAFRYAGYDYATIPASSFSFPYKERDMDASVSLNTGGVITDRDTYERYIWPDPSDYSYENIEKGASLLPSGMKFMIQGPGGVLENVIELCGYQDLCYLLVDDPDLVTEICNQVGSRLLEYYTIACKYDSVGIIMDNDDWGFNTQTMLSLADMRKLIYPWHKKIVDAAHSAGKPVVLHSCGNAEHVYEDMIELLHIDGKHSYEDAIEPVEQAYEHLQGRLAVLGGLDVDFMVRKSPEEIFTRAKKLVSKGTRGYALGTGNSVPEYIPDEHYYAMLLAALT